MSSGPQLPPRARPASEPTALHPAAPVEPAATFSYFPAIPPPRGISLIVLPKHTCNYLPDRQAISRAALVEQMTPETYHDLMDRGFRRSGRVVYQPVCPGCRQCQPIRVPTKLFRPSKSQRRAVKRNSDLRIAIGDPTPTQEKFDLYRAYLSGWHKRQSPESVEDFVAFLYESPVNTLEFTYREPAGKLLAVGICDVSPRALSSVYFYFDPASMSRSLGTFGVMNEIQFARAEGIAHYYLGYWIDTCPCMVYKSRFRPFEVLWPDQVWRERAVSLPAAR